MRAVNSPVSLRCSAMEDTTVDLRFSRSRKEAVYSAISRI